jgi:hypothetical protein
MFYTGGRGMTSRIFSINLDDVTFAKLGELKKSYPTLSRNGMIRHIINEAHLLETEGVDDEGINWKSRCEALQIQIRRLKNAR